MVRAALVSLVVLLTSVAVRADDPPKDFFFQPNDRVVFLGDSITEQYQYSTYVELYLTSRFPNANMVFLNAGISGDTAAGGANRFADHVPAEKPTKILINFGMNDAGYGDFNEKANKVYIEKTEFMLAEAKKAGIKVCLLSPNAVDRRVNPNFKRYVETQKRFYAPLAELAKKHDAVFVDMYAITRAAVEAMEKDDPKAEKAKPYYDGFHTASPGGLLMAHAILTGLKAPAMTLPSVDQTKTAEQKPDALSTTTLSFTRSVSPLSMPLMKDWVPMLPYINKFNDLNSDAVVIKSLSSGNYEMMLAGKSVGIFTEKDFAEGVNLGTLTAGPNYERGVKLLEAINAKNNKVHDRFRQVVMFQMPAWLKDVGEPLRVAERAKRLEVIEKLQKDVYTLAKPVAVEVKIVERK